MRMIENLLKVASKGKLNIL